MDRKIEKMKRKIILDDITGKQVTHLSRRKRTRFSLYSPIDMDNRKLNQLIDFSNQIHLPRPICHMIWDNGEKTLVYPAFKTFREYLREYHPSAEIMKIISGFISISLDLQGKELQLDLSSNTLVVMGNQGSILNFDFEPILHPSESIFNTDIRKLSELIKEELEVVKSPLLGNKDLVVLFGCMTQGSTKARRRRLLAAPILLSPTERVFTFIPTIGALLGCHGKLKARVLQNIRIQNWVKTMEDYGCVEMRAVYWGRPTKDNHCLIAFVAFLRNVVVHVHERRKNLLKLWEIKGALEGTETVFDEEAVLKHMKLATKDELYKKMKLTGGGGRLLGEMIKIAKGDRPVDPSPLEENPQRILDLIDQVHPNLLSELFRLTYACTGDMGLLDRLGL